MTRIWKLNGKYEIINAEQFGEIKNTSLDEISSLLPGGAYTTFRTYEHFKVVSLTDHFKRLEETAALAGKSLKLDYQKLRETIREIINSETAPDLRIRITVDLEDKPGLIYISYESLVNPGKEVYDVGVNTITINLHRNNPKAKLTGFISESKVLKTKLQGNLNEVLMVNNQQEILEGLTSNFYGVIENRILTADNGVLMGITRAAVLDEAKKFGFEVVYRPIKLSELDLLEEAFLTSSSRIVLPVRSIDAQIIGNGKPGVITLKLMDLMKKRLVAEYEEL
jgi:branched-chain amino acid aminotransferase